MRYLAFVAGEGPADVPAAGEPVIDKPAPVGERPSSPRPGPVVDHPQRSLVQSEPRRTAVAAALIGAAAGVLLTALISTMAPAGSESTAESADPKAAPTSHSHASAVDPFPSPSVLGTQASRPSAPTPLDRCRQVVAAQAAPLKSAVAALDQWEVHVGAMNQLVTGAITLDQANAFWNQTRVGAHRNVNAFQAAHRAYRQDTQANCPKPEQLTGSSMPLRACADTVVAQNNAIRAAETSVRTWGRHVHHMEMLRMGHLTPAKATEMWLASWQKGVRELDQYHDALRKTRAHHC